MTNHSNTMKDNNKDNNTIKDNNKDTSTDWLSHGEVAKLKNIHHTINTPSILNSHLSSSPSLTVTRFPPEPNGYLHLGHAKAINLSFEYSLINNGVTYLRFDDTNPRNEKEEFYKSIVEDVEWLGFKPFKITYASDYFDILIDYAFKLIDKGKAYVCHLDLETMRQGRRVGGVTEGDDLGLVPEGVNNSDTNPNTATINNPNPNTTTINNPNPNTTTIHKPIPSPFRDRSIETNRVLFKEMIEGKWKEGSACLRLKMDLNSTDPLMYDLVAYRIIKGVNHYRTGLKYNVYPSYDYTHCICDSIENITHSFCSREFFIRRNVYYWVLQELNLFKPFQWEFNRLNIKGVVLSKRKLTHLSEIYNKWDDPRLFTICGLRRRGVTKEGINKFVKQCGLTYSFTVIDKKLFEKVVREELSVISNRVMCVVEGLRVLIIDDKLEGVKDMSYKQQGVKNSTIEQQGVSSIEESVKDMSCKQQGVKNSTIEQQGVNDSTDTLHPFNTNPLYAKVSSLVGYSITPFNSEICWIENKDFNLEGGSNFYRLSKDRCMGLYGYCTIKYKGSISIGSMGQDIEDKCLIVEKCVCKAKKYVHWVKEGEYKEVEVRMYDYENGGLGVFKSKIRKEDLKGIKREDRFQFMRVGYFCLDEDSDISKERYVFNLTVNLRNLV